ncbi:hypothetical protein F0160_31195 [Paraburkholderia sp. JPY303]|uniref:hypothetical protein n=1 Tax=Paraburkholderia atlantica TaxID=2654982 RepID=UPI001591D441|nr:hypothetical protein [Paraburkholderia atlantica]NUY34920.1 hypothetical protein [Paraburkholderia atlantica]
MDDTSAEYIRSVAADIYAKYKGASESQFDVVRLTVLDNALEDEAIKKISEVDQAIRQIALG